MSRTGKSSRTAQRRICRKEGTLSQMSFAGSPIRCSTSPCTAMKSERNSCEVQGEFYNLLRCFYCVEFYGSSPTRSLAQVLAIARLNAVVRDPFCPGLASSGHAQFPEDLRAQAFSWQPQLCRTCGLLMR